MAHWLVKSEPGTWSWDDQVAAGTAGTFWDGVRNPQAHAAMKAMVLGDRAFFYHSGEAREIVGIVTVSAPWARDPADGTGRWGAVRFEAVGRLPEPVTLAAAKAEPRLSAMVLVKNSRLSVQPVTDDEWALVCAMGGASV